MCREIHTPPIARIKWNQIAMSPRSRQGVLLMNALHPTLVILAAGMGRRYGGLKQIERFGPGGETILDYSIFDALRAGFRRILCVIRREMEEDFGRLVVGRLPADLDLALCFQDLHDLPEPFVCPAGRTRPWGTGHAVLALRDQVSGPFAVINADDFYGCRAFELLAGFLSGTPRSATPEQALVGFELCKTLSRFGPVSRAICKIDARGYLENLTEFRGIVATEQGPGIEASDGSWRILPVDTIASLNLFGFFPAILEELKQQFRSFLSKHGEDTETEFFLSDALGVLVRRGGAEIRVLTSPQNWFGVTHVEDREPAICAIDELVKGGVYPPVLWPRNPLG